jgi:branched-chain amino acid transport system ATP-binding protein
VTELAANPTPQAVLETLNLNLRFGSVEVASNINFRLERGARHALIGPNGAGKTTFVNLLTGQVRPSSGSIHLNGRDVSTLSTDRRVRLGLARTFQINTLLKGLSVLENIQLAVLEHRGQGNILFFGRSKQVEAAEAAYALLERLQLADVALRRVSELSYGRQRLIEVAIGLALEPDVLLLDEPAAGVAPADSDRMFELIEMLPDSIAVLIIEHDMKLVFRFARRISVLVQGKILVAGSPEDIAKDQRVRDVYLGSRAHV